MKNYSIKNWLRYTGKHYVDLKNVEFKWRIKRASYRCVRQTLCYKHIYYNIIDTSSVIQQ